MRRLRRELELAGVEMARSRAAIERIMNEVCMVTSVPMDLRRIEGGWIDDTAARLDTAIVALDEQRPDPGPMTITGFPQGHAGDCGQMEQGIGKSVDVMASRIHDLREDLWNLRVLVPNGEKSFGGHVTQAEGWQIRLEKQLKTWGQYGDCPDSLTVDVAREYAKLNIRADVGWSAATVAGARKGHDWWDVDLAPVAKLAAGVAGAAAAVAGAAVAVSRAAEPIAMVFG